MLFFRGKRRAIAQLIEYTDPDILILTETKIDNSIRTARNIHGGGAMIALI